MDGRKHFIASLAFCVVIFAVPCTAGARIIYVDAAAPAPGDGSSWQTAYKYLQDALADAKTAGEPVEIRVAQGVYKPDRSAAHPEGTRNRSATFRLLDEVTMRGGFGGLAALDPNARDLQLYRTVLSGDLAGNDVPLSNPMGPRGDPSRADNCDHVVSYNEDVTRMLMTDLTAELDGLAVTGGRAFHFKTSGNPSILTDAHCGGGLFIAVYHKAVGAVTIRNCTFEDNYAEEMGGAVYCWFVNHLVMEGCTIVGNASRGRGAGLSIREGEAKLSNCRIDHNWSAFEGGAAFLSGCSVVFTGCSISQNRAQIGGGLFRSGGPAELIDCVLRENTASGSGGAILDDGTIRCVGSSFLCNRAAHGGVILVNSSGRKATLANCVLAGNVASNTGGVIWTEAAQVELLNCTVFGNAAPKGRFLLDRTPADTGIYPRGGVHLTNCIVSDGSDEIWNSYGAITIQYTDLPGGRTAVHDPAGTITWGLGNIDADPCFVDPGYWDPNGTPEDPNDDFFVEGDYHLKSQAGRWDPAAESWVVDDVTSPCIDAGDPNSPVGEEPFPNGGRVDMGAYGGTAEASKSYLAVAKVVYVDDDAPAPGDGSSWQTAYQYLQDALADAKAAEKPAEICVAQGIYMPDRGGGFVRGSRSATFRLINGVALRGGYAGLAGPDPDARDVKQYESVLSGDLQGNDPEVDDLADLLNANVGNSYTVVTGSGTDSTAVLDGFTVARGYFNIPHLIPGPGAAGMYNQTGSGADSTAVLDAFTVTRGYFVTSHLLPDPGAGGMSNLNGSPTVLNCTFTRNASPDSAAMYNGQVSNPTLIDCVFTRNYAVTGGAGIANRNSRPKLVRCIFRDNDSRYGAAMYNGESSPVVDTCTFVRNWGFEGGAIYNLQSSPTLNGCLFQENTAGAGGAVRNDEGSTLTIDACVFTGNSAKYGGAVWDGHSSVRSTISNCIFRANTAGRYPGAIFVNNSSVTNCIFAGNRALTLPPNPEHPSIGGAILTSNITLTNCTFDGNWAEFGRAIFGSRVSGQARNCIFWGSEDLICCDYLAPPMDVRYSNIQHGWSGEGNIDTDPCFVRHGRWADRDDPNRAADPNDPNAIWVDGDYHLKSQAGRWDPISKNWVIDEVTSPYIDAGDPNSPIGLEPFPNGGRVNMGAYGGTAEASMSNVDGAAGGTISTGSLNGDGRVDFANLQILVSHWPENGTAAGIIISDVRK